jgi:hypothetical protein
LSERRTALTRLALFGAGLIVVAAAAAFAGQASGIDIEDASADGMTHGAESEAESATGLSDAASGFRFRLDAGVTRAGLRGHVAVTLERDGKPFTRLDITPGEPPLHLIFVRRDLAGYVHVHPHREGDSFTTGVTLPSSGVWRAYADFEVDGAKIVLGRDVFVPGEFTPERFAAPQRTATVDGYDVRLRRGVDLIFEIRRGGRPVFPLQPHLGAAGHLVAIRQDDLAYLHVHPRERLQPGAITFEVELSEPGRYALFLQFRHGGSVHTVPFTLVAT